MDSTALTVKVFGDGADLAGILALAENPAIKGFTTNPTLMRQAGVDDYEAFAHEVLASVGIELLQRVEPIEQRSGDRLADIAIARTVAARARDADVGKQTVVEGHLEVFGRHPHRAPA